MEVIERNGAVRRGAVIFDSGRRRTGARKTEPMSNYDVVVSRAPQTVRSIVKSGAGWGFSLPGPRPTKIGLTWYEAVKAMSSCLHDSKKEGRSDAGELSKS